MVFQWFMNSISLVNTSRQTEQVEKITSTFARFPELPTEIRLQIWEYYFDVPRIHVFYQGPLKSPSSSSGYQMAYTDLTARTNRDMSPHIRFAAAAINHEAWEVFRKIFDFVHMNSMAISSKQLRDLFDDKLRGVLEANDPDQPLSMSVIPKDILHSTPHLDSFVRNPSGTPPHLVMPGVHINWKNDLLYFTDGGDVNCEMLRRACNGPFASKLRRVAILIHDSYKYDGWRRFYGPSVDFPKPSAKLTEVILVVSLRDIERNANATLERDEFGFVPYDSVVKKEGRTWESMQNMKLIERRFVYVSQLLHEAFPDLEDDKIKWAVDIDYTYNKSKTQYSREVRG